MKRLDSRIAGNIREVDVWVGDRKCLNPKEINEELIELCNLGIFPILSESLIKRWHIQFEKIHPFEDGNGRTGRILMNIQRLKIDLPILIIHEGREQYNYYKWFK
jgi:fido (protein-threonine AMPylation protein)